MSEVCIDRAPKVPPCYGAPQSAMGVPWKQSTIVNMKTDVTVKTLTKRHCRTYITFKNTALKLNKIN